VSFLNRPFPAPRSLRLMFATGFLPARVQRSHGSGNRPDAIDRVGGNSSRCRRNGSTFVLTAPSYGILSISLSRRRMARTAVDGSADHRGVGLATLVLLAAGAAVSCSSSISCYCVSRALDAGYEPAKTNSSEPVGRLPRRRRGLRDPLDAAVAQAAAPFSCSSASCRWAARSFAKHSIAWTPGVFARHLGYTTGNAAGMKAVFGPPSARSPRVVTGWLSDRIGVNGRCIAVCSSGQQPRRRGSWCLMSDAFRVAPVGVVASARHRHGRVLPLGTLFLPGRRFCFSISGKKQASAAASGNHRTAWAIWAPLCRSSVARGSVAFGLAKGVFVSFVRGQRLGGARGSSLYFEQTGVRGELLHEHHQRGVRIGRRRGLTIEWADGAVAIIRVWLRDLRRTATRIAAATRRHRRPSGACR